MAFLLFDRINRSISDKTTLATEKLKRVSVASSFFRIFDLRVGQISYNHLIDRRSCLQVGRIPKKLLYWPTAQPACRSILANSLHWPIVQPTNWSYSVKMHHWPTDWLYTNRTHNHIFGCESFIHRPRRVFIFHIWTSNPIFSDFWLNKGIKNHYMKIIIPFPVGS